MYETASSSICQNPSFNTDRSFSAQASQLLKYRVYCLWDPAYYWYYGRLRTGLNLLPLDSIYIAIFLKKNEINVLLPSKENMFNWWDDKTTWAVYAAHAVVFFSLSPKGKFWLRWCTSWTSACPSPNHALNMYSFSKTEQSWHCYSMPSAKCYVLC